MPTARLFAQTARRRIALLAIVAALALALTSLVTTQSASACPGPPPKPLRALYMDSDLIVVARVGETTPVEVFFEEGEKYRSYLMKTDLHVSSTVKGQGNHSVVHLYHLRWESDEFQAPHFYSEYSDSDKLLIFLTRRETGEGYEETDRSYGVKKLSDADLQVYLRRMDELALILQQEKPDPAQIVEWLIRCAEEPATRWDGIYEFVSSDYALQASRVKEEPDESQETGETNDGAASGGEANHASDNSGNQANDNAVTGENSGENGDTIPDQQIVILPMTRERFYTPDPELIRLLTAAQKKRLANVLFNAKTLTEDESLLIDLVKQWGDPRFVPFAMSQLRSYADDPPNLAETLVTAVAEALDNEELKKLAAKYCENASYYDEEEASGDEAEVVAESAGETQKEETEADVIERAYEESLSGNSAQKRSMRLQRFIARVEGVPAD